MTKNKEGTPSAGLDPELVGVGADGARDAIAKAGARAADLVAAWIEAKNAAAVAALAGDESAPAAARKAAKRGLNVLKARGIPLPERTRVARLTGDPIEDYEAWFVPPDGSGTSVFTVASRRQSGRYRLVHAAIREGVGLLEVRGIEMSRTQLRSSFEDTARRIGFGPVSIPVDWARWRIAAAKSENAKSGAVLPLAHDSYPDLLQPIPREPPPHPLDGAKLDVPAPSSAVPTSARLHGDPEFAGWMPSGPAVQELMIELGQRLGAVGSEPEQTQIDAAVGTAIDAATDRFFSPEIRERLAERMKDSALALLVRLGEAPPNNKIGAAGPAPSDVEARERAAEVIAIAQATKSAGLITEPPHDIPFLRGFFQKALAMLAAQSEGQLSIPIPAGPAVEPAGEKSSPGGIILP